MDKWKALALVATAFSGGVIYTMAATSGGG